MPTVVGPMTRGAAFNYVVELNALGAVAPTAKTLASDRLALSSYTSTYIVDGEASADDDIDGISGWNENQFILLRAATGRTLTLKDENAGAASTSDRLRLPAGGDVVLHDDELAFLWHDDTLDRWILVSGPSFNSAAFTGTNWTDLTDGGATTLHTHAGGGGSVATDAIWDAAGDLAVGTGADTAARLAITVPAANILEVLGVVNGETTASWKAVHDGTAPVTQAAGDAAAAGTALTASHRDHKHGMPATYPATAHNMLSAQHADATVGAATRGDVITAQGASPTWARLAASVPAANLRNVLGFDNGDTEPAWKALLDATAPAAIGTAAAGTALTASHRDHVHATGAGTPSTQAFGDAAATGSGPAAAMTDHKHAMPANPTTGKFVWMEIARWYLDGNLRADTSVHQGLIIQLPPWAANALLVEGSSFKANVRTAPAGAADIFDITIASSISAAQTSLFAGGTPDYPSIAAASTDASADDGTLTTTSLTGGYFLRLFVRQVGSTAGSEGEDCTVQLFAKVYLE